MLGKPGIAGLLILAAGSLAADDRPDPAFWSGKLGEKTKFASLAAVETQDDDAAESANSQAIGPDVIDKTPDEPEWLKRLDKTDRSTLTGGWGLQNLSGGTQSFTTAGNHAGQYAPNTYQGRQFQQWNNISTRQQTPSWNGPAPMFPREMWSQGYVSPNSYCGPANQTWGGMMTGQMQPNLGSGGWTWR